MDTVILDPVIPYVGPIGGSSFALNEIVNLEGTILPYAYGFDINLQCGPNTFPHDDIAMQISVRFLNGYISLNSSHEGIWGKEIRLSNAPIEADQKFKVTVLCEFKQYKVSINDEHYYIFPHRIQCEKVSHLSIDGDVSINRISYKSICDSISDCTSTLSLAKNQFNDIEHPDSPPTDDNVMICSEDVESQNWDYQNKIIRVGSSKRCYIVMFCLSVISIINAWYSRYNSYLKAILKSGFRTFFIYLCIIAIITVCGYIIYLISQYSGKYSRDAWIDKYDQENKAAIKEMNEHDTVFSDIQPDSKRNFKKNWT